MGGFILFLGSIFGPAAAIAWRLYAQRRIWVGQYKGRSVKVVLEGRSKRVLLDDDEILVEHSWSKDGVFEFEYEDVEHGSSSGLVVLQFTSSGNGYIYHSDLILNGETISLTQLPSRFFKQASLEEADLILKAKTVLENTPQQDVQWDEILRLCKDIRELTSDQTEITNAVNVLQEQLKERRSLVQRIERSIASYHELGVDNPEITATYEKARTQRDEAMKLLKDLHTSVLNMQLSSTLDSPAVLDIIRHIDAENKVEEQLNDQNRKKKLQEASAQQRIL